MNQNRHPIAALLPDLSPERFAALKDDIRANGQQRPIELYAGEILDGWHRYRARMELGVHPRFTEFLGDPIKLIRGDARRRDLTEGQRAGFFAATDEGRAAARAAEQAGAGRPKNVLPETHSPKRGRTRDLLAEEAQVSPATMGNAMLVVAKGTPQEVEQLLAGRKGAKALAEEIRERTGRKRPKQAKPPVDLHAIAIELRARRDPPPVLFWRCERCRYVWPSWNDGCKNCLSNDHHSERPHEAAWFVGHPDHGGRNVGEIYAQVMKLRSTHPAAAVAGSRQ